MYPDRVFIVRFEDVVRDPKKALGQVCEKIGLESADSLKLPTWNGNPLEEVYPWGTIRKATLEANRATAEELSAEEIEAVRVWAGPYLAILDYAKFI
jgi:hypothetical protein